MKCYDNKMMYCDDKMYWGDNPCCYKPYPKGDCDPCETEYMEEDCCAPKIKCKPAKECVKTYKCYYKLYKFCYYRLFKVCPRCGHEFDYYSQRGVCNKCR